MNLATTITLRFGGPGSGCRGPNCGRKSSGVVKDAVTDLVTRYGLPSAVLKGLTIAKSDIPFYNKGVLHIPDPLPRYYKAGNRTFPAHVMVVHELGHRMFDLVRKTGLSSEAKALFGKAVIINSPALVEYKKDFKEFQDKDAQHYRAEEQTAEALRMYHMGESLPPKVKDWAERVAKALR